jgi:hypothetical protein
MSNTTKFTDDAGGRQQEETGAVDYAECPHGGGPKTWWRGCHCGPCAICSHAKHTAIHGPLFGQPPGSKPYGHAFVPGDTRNGRTR